MRDIEHQVAVHEVFTQAAGGAPAGAADARGQLVEIKRFHQKIVGARVQARDALAHLVARRDDQHGAAVAMVAQHAQRLHAVLPRQAQVEQDTAIVVQTHGRVRLFSAGDPVDGIAALFQADLRGATQLRIVFGQQDAHGVGAGGPLSPSF